MTKIALIRRVAFTRTSVRLIHYALLTFWIIALALSGGFGCAAEHSTTPPPAASPRPRRVRAEPTREIRQAVGDEVVGTLRARSVAAISPSVMGRVRSVSVTVGSRVRADQLLISLSADEIEAKANQAKAHFAQADVELQRAEQLWASRSISASQYDAVHAQHQIAEAALAEANVMRNYTSIRAPFAGVITAKQCDVGDLAMPGKPLLVLESPGALRFEAAVPEASAHALSAGAGMTVRIDASQKDMTAIVSELSPAADPASRTVTVKLDLPDTPGLRAGMFGRLEVPTGEERSVVVPSAAIVRRGQLETVFVVADRTARLRLVRSGRTREGQTEILAGLEQGESVVVAEADNLGDGEPVEVLP